MAFSQQDERFMRQALELARRGTALVSPGARVGAVITDSTGQLIGEGFYTFDGVKHAEVLALEQAGSRARGGTIYLNLEPHCHQGRTPPCTDALIAAGIQRVVAAMADPNPKLPEKGLINCAQPESLLKLDCSKPRLAGSMKLSLASSLLRLPLVTLKSGMTLDGKIAPPPGDSFNPSALGATGATGGWITSEEARAHVQELRHESDAIMVGVGTIIADDPLLTDRTGLPRRRPLLRVILDSRLRCPLDSRLVKTSKDDVLIFCSFAEEKKRRQLEEHGIRVEQVPLGSE